MKVPLTIYLLTHLLLSLSHFQIRTLRVYYKKWISHVQDRKMKFEVGKHGKYIG